MEDGIRKLLGRVSAGERAGTQAFVSAYQNRIFGYFVQRGCLRADAEDLTQETLRDVLRKIGEFDPEKGSLESWLDGFCRREFAGWVRADRRRTIALHAYQVVKGVGTRRHPVARRGGGGAGAAALGDYLARIPAHYRVAIVSRLVHGSSTRDIARSLGLTRQGVRKRIRLGLRMIRAMYQADAGSPGGEKR